MQNYRIINQTTALAVNKVLRKTYLLLSLTILVSAATAYLALLNNLTGPGPIMTILGMMGLMFLTQAFRNSPLGIVTVLAFTAFMGYTLTPILTFYLHAFTNGGSLVVTALGGTGMIFLGLSLFVLLSRKDFSYLGGFLFVTLMVACLGSLASLFLPMLQIFISALFILLASALILFHTSQIINGGESNYISATVSLYVALFNLFLSLLNVLSFFSGRRD